VKNEDSLFWRGQAPMNEYLPLLLVGVGLVLLGWPLRSKITRRTRRTAACGITAVMLAAAVPAGHSDSQWRGKWTWTTSTAECVDATNLMDHGSSFVSTNMYLAYRWWWIPGQPTESCRDRWTVPTNTIWLAAQWWKNGNGQGGGELKAAIGWLTNDRGTAESVSYSVQYPGLDYYWGPGYYTIDTFAYTSVTGCCRGDVARALTNHQYFG
jgi:hypothetical protein